MWFTISASPSLEGESAEERGSARCHQRRRSNYFAISSSASKSEGARAKEHLSSSCFLGHLRKEGLQVRRQCLQSAKGGTEE